MGAELDFSNNTITVQEEKLPLGRYPLLGAKTVVQDVGVYSDQVAWIGVGESREFKTVHEEIEPGLSYLFCPEAGKGFEGKFLTILGEDCQMEQTTIKNLGSKPRLVKKG